MPSLAQVVAAYCCAQGEELSERTVPRRPLALLFEDDFSEEELAILAWRAHGLGELSWITAGLFESPLSRNAERRPMQS